MNKKPIVAALFLLMPFVLYGLMKYYGPRPALLLILLFLIRRYVLTFLNKNKEITFFLVVQIGLVLALLGYSYYTNHPLTVKLIPPLFSFFLFFSFSFTLLKGPSMIERFAQLKHPVLSSSQQHYCRAVTLIWSVFFLTNAVFLTVIAVFFSLEWWLLATGPISYILIGLLFGSEYAFRTIRFQSFNFDFFVDRFLYRVWTSLSSREREQL